jgi:hypothetical protein
VRYLMLLTNPAEVVERWTSKSEAALAEREAEQPKWGAFLQWAGEQGLELNGLELDSPRTAKTLRADDGRHIVSDGPYPETKEVVGGLFVVDLPDLDRAIEIASRVPVAETGSVEIRPLLDRE